MIGVRALAADTLTIEDCAFEFPQPTGAPDVVGACVLLQGDCSGVAARNCSFVSVVPPSFTGVTQANLATATGADVAAGTAASTGVAAAPTPPSAGSAGASASPSVSDAAANLFAVDTASRLKAIAALSPVGVIVKAAPPAPVISTIGILASSSLAGNIVSMCRLGDAMFRGNAFTDLTMPALMFEVDSKTLRLQDNDATGCVAGLWMFLTGGGAPTGANAVAYDTLLSAMIFREALLAVIIGELYPLPAGATATPAGAVNPSFLTMTNNGFEAIPSVGQGNVAVFISANRPITTEPDTTVSLLLSGNRLRSQSFKLATTASSTLPVPTVFIVMPDDERCAITGNLILNENLGGTDGITSGGSLVVLPNTPADGTTPGTIRLLAIAGNVLRGTTNLGVLRRSSTAGDTWLPYNSVG
jgi:hypothetical protein